MVKELRKWLEEDEKNVIVNRSGHDQDLISWYTDFGVKNIWVAYAADEHELGSVAVRLPKNRAQLVRFLLEGLDHSEECTYNKNLDLLHVNFSR